MGGSHYVAVILNKNLIIQRGSASNYSGKKANSGFPGLLKSLSPFVCVFVGV